jgi:transposase
VIRTVNTEVFAEMYATGLSCRTIGAKFGVDARLVRSRLRKAGVSLRPTRIYSTAKTSQTVIEDAAAMYRSGMSAEAIGAKTGVSVSVVIKRLRRAGVELRSRGSGPHARLDSAVLHETVAAYEAGASLRAMLDPALLAQMTAEYEKGTTLRAIGSKFGISRFTVAMRLRIAGVQVVRRKRGQPARVARAADPSKPRRHCTRVTDELIEMLVAAYREEPSVSTIAANFGANTKTVRRIVKLARVSLIRKHRSKVEKPPKVRTQKPRPVIEPPSPPNEREEFNRATEILRAVTADGPADAGIVAAKALLADCGLQYRTASDSLGIAAWYDEEFRTWLSTENESARGWRRVRD